MGRYIFSCSRKIIALNSAIRAHLVAMGADEDKIEIIPNAVDTCFFSPKRESFLESNWGISSPVVLFVGRLVEDKGIKYLMQAFAEVVEAIPSAKLVIVGKGPQETELRRLQEKFGLNNVFFLGTVESRLMPNVYAGSDVLVLPSVHEPFGNVVIEAMSSGIPVVGSYVGGMKDTIVHGVSGYHVQPRNSKQLSRYMIRLLEDASLGKKLGENARKNVLERYTVGLLLQRIEKIYQQCIVT